MCRYLHICATSDSHVCTTCPWSVVVHRRQFSYMPTSWTRTAARRGCPTRASGTLWSVRLWKTRCLGPCPQWARLGPSCRKRRDRMCSSGLDEVGGLSSTHSSTRSHGRRSSKEHMLALPEVVSWPLELTRDTGVSAMCLQSTVYSYLSQQRCMQKVVSSYRRFVAVRLV